MKPPRVRPVGKSKTTEPDPPEIQRAARSLVPGQSFIARWRDAGDETATAFIIRETRERIRELGASPRVKFRCFTVRFDRQALPFLALIRVNDRDDMTYEFWIDSLAAGGKDILSAVLEQRRLAISFYSETKRQRRIPVYSNRKLAAAAERHLALIAGRVWEGHAFNRARENLSDRFPTASSLWEFAQTQA